MNFKNKRQFMDLMEFLFNTSNGILEVADLENNEIKIVLPNGMDFEKLGLAIKNKDWDSEKYCEGVCNQLREVILPNAKNISFKYKEVDNTWFFDIDDETLEFDLFTRISDAFLEDKEKPKHTKTHLRWKQYLEKISKFSYNTCPEDTHGWN